jgi:hypothetical protein
MRPHLTEVPLNDDRVLIGLGFKIGQLLHQLKHENRLGKRMKCVRLVSFPSWRCTKPVTRHFCSTSPSPKKRKHPRALQGSADGGRSPKILGKIIFLQQAKMDMDGGDDDDIREDFLYAGM